MNNKNKLTNILLCVLIAIGMCNLALSFSNALKLSQLHNLPAVVINDQSLSSANITESTTEPKISEKETTSKEETTDKNAEEATKKASDEKQESSEKVTEKNTAEQENDNSGYCYVTDSGTKYHKAGCSYLKKSKTKLTINQAKNSGYSPCSRCY